MLSTILNIVAAVVMAFAFSKVFLVIGRTIAGLALGMVILILGLGDSQILPLSR